MDKSWFQGDSAHISPNQWPTMFNIEQSDGDKCLPVIWGKWISTVIHAVKRCWFGHPPIFTRLRPVGFGSPSPFTFSLVTLNIPHLHKWNPKSNQSTPLLCPSRQNRQVWPRFLDFPTSLRLIVLRFFKTSWLRIHEHLCQWSEKLTFKWLWWCTLIRAALIRSVKTVAWFCWVAQYVSWLMKLSSICAGWDHKIV